MISTTACIGLLAALPTVWGLGLPHAEPTPKDVDALGLLNGKSPAPTAAPKNWLGYEPKHALFARQETLTCGFFDHDPSRPNLCSHNSQCLFDDVANYFGCCSNGGSCGSPRSCLTYDGGSNAGPIITGNAVLCGPDAPECQTTLFPTVNGLSDTGPYTHFDCVPSAVAVLTLYQDTTRLGGSHNSSIHSTSSTTSHSSFAYPNRTTTTTTRSSSDSSTTSTTPSSSLTSSASSSSDSSSPAESTTSSSSGFAAHAQQTAAAGLLAVVLAAGGFVI